MSGQSSLGGGWGADSVEVDDYGNRGIYDERGEFDLEATKRELSKRFADVDERLPDTFAGYDRQDVNHRRDGLAARYVWTGKQENENGLLVTEREVTIFPRGPHLRDWCVVVREHHPEHDGDGSWLHQDALGLDEPGGAVATALAVMRGEVAP